MSARMRIGEFMAITAVIALPAASIGQEPDGFGHWNAAQLQRYEAELAPRVDARNIAIADRMIDGENYFAAMVHRQPGEGFAESHTDWVDIYFVTSGSGTLVVGGTIPDGTATSPGEIRGSTIVGGTQRPLAAGDIVHIPAGTPHNVVVEAGRQITYFIVKVQQ